MIRPGPPEPRFAGNHQLDDEGHRRHFDVPVTGGGVDTDSRGGLTAMIGEALGLAQAMERGQASTPLADLFASLQGDLDRSAFPVTLLALGQDAKAAALKWLYGQPFALLSVQVSARIGLVEVQLRDRGYQIESDDGRRQEFEDVERLQQALADFTPASGADPEAWRRAPKLSAAAAGNAKHLHVLLPQGVDFIRSHPALLTRLVRRSALLVVVAPIDHSLDEAERVVLRDLLEDIPAAWPVLVVDELAGEPRMPAHGWWKSLHAPRMLAPRLLTTHVAAELPAFFTALGDPVRVGLQQCHLLRRFVLALEALGDHHAQALAQLQSRKLREAGRAGTAAPAAANPVDQAWTGVRALLTAAGTELAREQEERSRRTLLRDSAFDQALKRHAEAVRPQDLEAEPGYKSIRLTLGDRFVHGYSQALRDAFKQAMREDIRAADARLENLAAQLESDLSRLAGHAVTVPRAGVDERALWSDLKELVSMELAYEGEMKKRGVLERLGEGRRSLFVILMSSSLLGYLGLNLRDSGWMGWLMVPVFIGGIAWSYVAWRREDRERLDKEVGKVRNELLQTSRRLAAEVERLKQRRLAEHVESARGRWQRQAEDLQRAVAERQAADARQSSAQGKQRVQLIEQQVAEWRALRPGIEAILKRARDAMSRALAALPGAGDRAC